MAGSHQIYPQPTPFFTTATPAANKLPVCAEILIAHSIPDSSRSPPAENAMFRHETLHFVCSIQFVLLTPSVLFQFRYGGAFLPTLCSPHSLFAQILPWVSVHPFTQWCPFPLSISSLFICLIYTTSDRNRPLTFLYPSLRLSLPLRSPQKKKEKRKNNKQKKSCESYELVWLTRLSVCQYYSQGMPRVTHPYHTQCLFENLLKLWWKLIRCLHKALPAWRDQFS